MITIVTDTSVGYTREEAASRGIVTVGLNYSISSIGYTEGYRNENGNFCASFGGKLLKTSQPSPENFKSVFEAAVSAGRDVLCITISSGLSGTYSAAVLAAKDYGDHVMVVDSAFAGSGQQLLVDEAVNMVVGGMSLEDIAAGLQEIKKKIGVVFTVETLDPLRRGGRLVISQAPNTTLNSRPILLCDSGIRFITNARGIKTRTRALADAIPTAARRVFLMKTGEDTDTRLFEAELKQKFPHLKIHSRTVGPVLTVHIGVGAVGVAYISK